MVPGLSPQYSWNTSLRLARLCPARTNHHSCALSSCLGHHPQKSHCTLFGDVGQTLFLEALVIHQVLDLWSGAVDIGVLEGDGKLALLAVALRDRPGLLLPCCFPSTAAAQIPLTAPRSMA